MAPAYFDPEGGRLSSEVFSSARLYKDEIARVFARSWLLVGPLSWLARPGDFITTQLGETPALAWRGPQGIEVFLNTCLGGDGRLADADRGCAEVLSCACHRWPYSASEASDRLRPQVVAKAACFGGFLFAACDPQTPPLRDWLGDFTWCWDLIERQFPGGIEVYGRTALRTDIRCNWKLAAEAYAGDVYSDLTLTKATRELLRMGAPLAEREGFQISTGAGAMAVLTGSGSAAEAGEAMTPVLATLFPNISYDGRAGALHVWRPLGATETAAYAYCLVGRDEPAVVKEDRRRRFQLLFGPTGLLSQDYAAAWAQVTRATQDCPPRALNLQMGLGRERRSNLPGRVDDLGSEMNQRTFYGWWQAQLAQPPPASTSAPDKVRMRRSIPRS